MFCKKALPSERVFMRHQCTQMVRSKEIQTVIGQVAFGLYKHWLEKQRRTPPSIETFCTSAYYTPFIKFAEWVRETGIIDPKKYVEVMLEKKIAPSLWRRNEAYQFFLEHVDKRTNPYDQATTTVETLMTLAEGLECAPGEVFAKFTAGEILELIQQRRLSPWLLFCSRAFKDWVNTLHEGDRSALMKGIGIDYWALQLEKRPEVVKALKEIASELGI